MTGSDESATLDAPHAEPSERRSFHGGTITLNNTKVIVPRDTIFPVTVAAVIRQRRSPVS